MSNHCDPNLLHLSYGGLSACEGKPLAGTRTRRKGNAPVCFRCALIADGKRQAHREALEAMQCRHCGCYESEHVVPCPGECTEQRCPGFESNA